MKKKYLESLENVAGILPLNLQLFAESGKDEKDEENQNDDSGDDSEDNSDDEEEKTITQSEMSKIAAREKKQGKRAAFKELGFKDEKEAKAEMAAFKQWKDSQLSPEEKAKKDLDDSKASQSEAEKRAVEAEEKLTIFMSGVRKDSVDDVLAIARVKVTEEKSLEEVISEMKKEERYKSFFADLVESGKGTGSNVGHGTGSTKKENIGERLGKAQKAINNKKSSYF